MTKLKYIKHPHNVKKKERLRKSEERTRSDLNHPMLCGALFTLSR